MAENKVYYHGATVVDESQGNPPPYGSVPPSGQYGPPPGQYGPPPGQYGPPPPGLYGPTVVQATVVPTVMLTQQMGPQPARVACKSCQCEIVTRVETKPTLRTHLFAALLCVIGCWPCVCVPYCMDSCMNTDHYCPNCNAYVGSYLT